MENTERSKIKLEFDAAGRELTQAYNEIRYRMNVLKFAIELLDKGSGIGFLQNIPTATEAMKIVLLMPELKAISSLRIKED